MTYHSPLHNVRSSVFRPQERHSQALVHPGRPPTISPRHDIAAPRAHLLLAHSQAAVCPHRPRTAAAFQPHTRPHRSLPLARPSVFHQAPFPHLSAVPRTLPSMDHLRVAPFFIVPLYPVVPTGSDRKTVLAPAQAWAGLKASKSAAQERWADANRRSKPKHQAHRRESSEVRA